MKIFILLIICIIFPLHLAAQQQEEKTTSLTDSLTVTTTESPRTNSGQELSLPLNAPITASETASPFYMYGPTPFYYIPSSWELHQGFNASIGMSLTFSPSKYAPSGAGFGQDAAFMYAMPLGKRFSAAAGVYASNLDWGHLSYKNVGFAAIVGFKATERISLYAYGNKSFIPQRFSPYYPFADFNADKLGGMVHFKLGTSSSISIGIEGRRINY